MRNFKLFAFGGSASKFQAIRSNFVNFLADKYGEITVEPTIVHREGIYFTPPATATSTYGATSACTLISTNPGYNTYTFSITLGDLFASFKTITDEGKEQGTNLFFGITKTELPETISKNIEDMDILYRKLAKEQNIEAPFRENGSYSFSGMKLRENGFKFTKLDLGAEFVMAVEVVTGKESGRKYNTVREFWGVEFGVPTSNSGASNNGPLAAMMEAAPTAGDVEADKAAPTAPTTSVEAMRDYLSPLYGLKRVSLLSDAEVISNYKAELATA